MKITRRQLRRIIREAIDPLTWQGEHIVGDLVHSIDYVGDGWGGDFEKVVGDQVGTVVEIDEDPDGTQYVVLFPDGTTVMDTASSFEPAK